METNHLRPVPDGDQVLAPGVPHWSDLLRPGAAAIDPPTQQLPALAPLLTRAARHRSRQVGNP
ncbi:hypothetical protein JQS43_14295 [Natronosporangium hydrolyticum]|uniref:Uncharacterized protein n=1 Tax=Natronosporangium hydrolyticum TaxID=2811111 RepID=A0A895YF75_9ACTN|nr:hypothetical protein [Natronosporangium hydrolyticum]QSB12850.1 hypothetical protein JQS43_14295 [Natronosporangium hydrolyticum]